MHLEPWYDAWLLPCFQAYYRADSATLREHLRAAHEQLALEAFNADERQALRYELAALQYYLDSLGRPNAGYLEDVHDALLHAVRAIGQPQQGPLSAAVQAYWLIACCGMGVRRNYFDLPEEDYTLLFNRVAPGQRTQLFWFFVAVRAYHRGDLRYLEQAAAAHSTEPTGFRDAFFFGCSRLMYRLVSGEATERDVTDFIRSFEHPNAVRDFKNLFLKRCIDVGLFGADATALLAEAERTLTALEGTFPQPYRRRTMQVLQNKTLYSAAVNTQPVAR